MRSFVAPPLVMPRRNAWFFGASVCIEPAAKWMAMTPWSLSVIVMPAFSAPDSTVAKLSGSHTTSVSAVTAPRSNASPVSGSNSWRVSSQSSRLETGGSVTADAMSASRA